MADSTQGFARGDWVVHLHHGVGQIKGIEKKQLEDQTTRYYRVKTHNSILWVPVDKVDRRVRPLATPHELKKALQVLDRPSKEMNEDHTVRKKRIKEVKSDGSLISVCRLIRDLWARRLETKLNATEERALHRLEERLVHEWAACKDLDVEQVRSQLGKKLQKLESQTEAG